MERPAVPCDLAVAWAQKYWGVDVDDASVLDGYDDANFRVTGREGTWMLKVHNAADSAPEGRFAEAQTALMHALASSGFPVPACLPLSQPANSSDGFTLRTTAAGRLHAVRLQAWMPGALLLEVPQSAALYCQLGALLARVDGALQAASDLATRFPALRRRFDWNLECLPDTYAHVRPQLLSLASVDVQLLDKTVAGFQQATAAAAASVRRSIIHSDANEKNVLVDAAAAAAAAQLERGSAENGGNAAAGGAPPQLITALIDWGDACEQWLAAEPAAACVYVMLLDRNADDPLPAAAALLAGYHAQLPLLPAERRLLRTLATGRLALSLSMGACAAAQQPDNAAYLLATQKHGWRLLRLLVAMSDADFLAAVGLRAH